MSNTVANLRRSPIHDALVSIAANRKPQWGELDGMPVVIAFADLATETQHAQSLALADVSALSRVVVKGPQATEFLQSQGLQLPAEVLRTCPIEQGGFMGRTGGTEFFLEDGPRGTTVARIEAALGAGGNGVYPVLRQDASLILSGARGPEALRQLSAFDFAEVPVGSGLVMTRVANISCMALSRQFNGINALQLWTDGTYGPYLWEMLLEVIHDLEGDAVGLAVFYPELSSPSLSSAHP